MLHVRLVGFCNFSIFHFDGKNVEKNKLESILRPTENKKRSIFKQECISRSVYTIIFQQTVWPRHHLQRAIQQRGLYVYVCVSHYIYIYVRV